MTNAKIVLKTLHNDIVNANKNSTLTTKKMRVWLRANMKDAHDANASWEFTQSQYDKVRAHFDPSYTSTKVKKASTPRVRKSRVIDEASHVVNNELHDTNA